MKINKVVATEKVASESESDRDIIFAVAGGIQPRKSDQIIQPAVGNTLSIM